MPSAITYQLKLLRVTAPHFMDYAIWHKHEGKWRCIFAAPTLRWMVKLDPKEVQTYIEKKGWVYLWL